MLRKAIYPLEGGKFDEAAFYIYDKAGRAVWGELRVRRENNPDTLALEARPLGTAEWKPMLKLTGHLGQLLVATFGIHGGVNDGDSARANEVADALSNQGGSSSVRNDPGVQHAEVRKDEPDPHAG